jgi:arsenate reductase
MVSGDDNIPNNISGNISGNKPGGVRGGRYRMLGPRREDPNAAPRQPRPPSAARAETSTDMNPHRTASAKKRVLFVCIGNSCRSQMAEAFARAYGSDILEVQSAGVSPATMIAPQTKQVLAERNLHIEDHFPKSMDIIRRQPFDLVVNMSGIPVVLPGARIVQWAVQDPIGQKESVYRTVASQLEGLVMRLILELRTASPPGKS